VAIVAERLEVSIMFYRGEIEIYVAGREAYLVTMSKEAEYNLDQAGGIGPYEYRCTGDGEVSPFIFRATEL
jgi:hypothetical protein